MQDLVSIHLGGAHVPPDRESLSQTDSIFQRPSTSRSKDHRPSGERFSDAAAKEARRQTALEYQRMNAQQRHTKYINDYVKFYGNATQQQQLQPRADLITEMDVIRENYKFIRSTAEDAQTPESWEKDLARDYYQKLFKEYCLGDFSRYKEGKVGLRWRTHKEVVSAKGQFICGNLACSTVSDLKSYEVNFVYMEDGVKKNALVKIRLCGDCARKLNYKKEKERNEEQRAKEKKERKKLRKREKEKLKAKKRKRRYSSSSSDSHSDSYSNSESDSSNSSDSDSRSRKHKRRSSSSSKRRKSNTNDVNDSHRPPAEIKQEPVTEEDPYRGLFL
jgi:protein FRA10AC1